MYNPTLASFGNTKVQEYIDSNSCPGDELNMIDWIFVQHASVDLRMAALSCKKVEGNVIFSQAIEWGTCNVQQISPMSNKPVCFTT